LNIVGERSDYQVCAFTFPYKPSMLHHSSPLSVLL
jgi:hypothetical protein